MSGIGRLSDKKYRDKKRAQAKQRRIDRKNIKETSPQKPWWLLFTALSVILLVLILIFAH